MRELKALLEDIRGRGWSVAVHNDYRLHGQRHTFWLFTCDKRALCAKGEGRTDEEALTQALAAIEGLGSVAHYMPMVDKFLEYAVGSIEGHQGRWTKTDMCELLLRAKVMLRGDGCRPGSETPDLYDLRG